MTGRRRSVLSAATACAAVVAVALATGCGDGSALNPRGEGAARAADLFWLMLALSALPFLAVCWLVAMAVVRRASGRAAAPTDHRTESRIVLIGGVVIPVLILVPVIAMTLSVSRAEAEVAEDALEVEVTGHQFWWDLRYPPPGSLRLGDAQGVRTANELHIPVGRTVALRLTSPDVIHSFWIPELAGKIDLVPGHVNTLQITASEPGVYRGRCAEFCGISHAHMRLTVVAQEPEEFARWLRGQARPVATMPDDTVRGELAASCASCHTMRGLFDEDDIFQGTLGPDLTHLASRRTLAAGAMPNTAEGLGRWILDPQGVKPGNNMPAVDLDPDDLADVVDYLRRLD